MLKKIVLSIFVSLILTGHVVAANADYYLPYPGILPDHPLYWLKMVRDRLSLTVTTKPAAKADKLLMYADKRLGAAWALIDGNKEALGVSTLTKAEKYLEQAVKAGNNDEFKQKLTKAIIKHEEVVRRLRGEVEESYVPYLDELLAKQAALRQALGASVNQDIEITIDFGGGEKTVATVSAVTALEALEKLAKEKNWEIHKKDYDFGTMVLGVGKEVYNTRYMSWIYYVNGQVADRSADKYELKAGDKVGWKYEAVKP